MQSYHSQNPMNKASGQISATIIEDVFSPIAAVPHGPTYKQPEHIAYGLQMPQPLKSNNQLSTSYMSSHNTYQTFKDSSFDSVQNGAFQTNAIRGRVTSPHIYQYDAQPVKNEKEDFAKLSGMSTKHLKEGPTNYQQSLDPKENLRNAIANMYAGASMLKTHEMGIYSIYKCPVENLTSGDYKYIVAVVPNHQYVPLGAFHSLQSLPWISFQTRATSNPAAEFGHNRPPSMKYHIPNNNNPLFDRINRVLEEPSKFVYMAETMPCKIEVLRSKEHNSSAASSTLVSALESFRCVIVMI